MPVAYRICKRRHPPFDATGAMLIGGRWSSPGRAIVYAAEHYATALLEVMAHAGRISLPVPHHGTRIEIPDDLAIEVADETRLAGWHAEGSTTAQDYGDEWAATMRTPVLSVPSVPGRPIERNLLINLAHPLSHRIAPSPPFPVHWDARFWR